MDYLNINTRTKILITIGKLFKEDIWKYAIRVASEKNNWFTEESITKSFTSWAHALQADRVQKWFNNYPKINNITKTNSIQLVLAGNLPMVGLHDILAVIASGQIAQIKLSSKDNILIPNLLGKLFEEFQDLDKYILLKQNLSTNPDALIATGSDTTKMFFSAEFPNVKSIIRGNRSSIAILTGLETSDELLSLSADITDHFGLGCRNVSQVFLPSRESLLKLNQALVKNPGKTEVIGYQNSLKQQETIFKLNDVEFIKSDNIILHNSEKLESPVGVLNYHFYSDLTEVKDWIEKHRSQIQCIVANHTDLGSTIKFGQSQSPELWDYADNIDTLSFLLNLSSE